VEHSDVPELAARRCRMSRKVVLAINAAWNVANFRRGLIRGLQQDGWEVVALAPRDEHVVRIEALGCRFVDIPIAAGGTNPWQDWRLYRDFRRILRAEAPDAMLGFTIKPNVFGSLAAHSLGIPVLNNIAGLGTAFIRQTWLTQIARLLYKYSLRHSFRVLFQNEDDRRLFVDSGLVHQAQTVRIPGSGVDLSAFPPQALPPRNDASPALRMLFIGRLLRDKGVYELVEAARILKARGVQFELELLGFCDAQNPTAIARAEVAAWQAEGLLRYLGSTDDVRPFIATAHVVVLPSYREGVPRTLLEAASMGRPLITTEAVGCRDAVDHGINGLLVRIRDAQDLAEKCAQLAEMPDSELQQWGANSRKKVELQFDEQFVIDTYRRLLAEIAPVATGR